MRLENYFQKNVVQPYRKRKSVLDINKLEKIYRIDKKYLFLLLGLLMFFLINREYFLFVSLTLLSAAFSFYHSKVNRTPLDFKLALFLGIFITRHYGILFTFIFFLISDIIPALLGGEAIQASTFVFVSWYFAVNALALIFPGVPLTTLGPILVVVEAIGSFFINSFFGIPGIMSIMVAFITVLIRIVYFLTLGNLLETIIGAI
jgi:hypothetical protein